MPRILLTVIWVTVGIYISSPSGLHAQEIGMWSNVFSSGNGIEGGVSAIKADSEGNVYIGGVFTEVGGVQANNILQWSGNQWSFLGEGFNDAVFDIEVADDGTVYAAGIFTQSGSSELNGVAMWNGESWESIGRGVKSQETIEGQPFVQTIELGLDGALYIGGNFTHAGDTTAVGLAKWDGDTWSPLVESFGPHGCGDIPRNDVYDILVDEDGVVYAAGNFVEIDGVIANGVAMWNGESWQALGNGATAMAPCNSSSSTFALYNGQVFANGSFLQIDGANQGVAKWNGAEWEALGVAPLSGGVFKLRASQDGVYAVGRFLQLGESSSNNIAKWVAGAWHSLGTGVVASAGLFAVEILDNLVFVGGTGVTEAGGFPSEGIALWEIVSRVTNEQYEETGFTSAGLINAYPNPLWNELHIKYENPGITNRDINISLHNILGQHIADLFEGSVAPGVNIYSWDASQLSAGAYIISIKLGADQESILIQKTKR